MINNRDRNVIKKETEKILKYKDFITQIQRMWNVIAKLIPVTTGGDWNHFKINQTISEQHTKRARNYGTANNSHIGHCTHTAKSAD
jgi:hypothetical protein